MQKFEDEMDAGTRRLRAVLLGGAAAKAGMNEDHQADAIAGYCSASSVNLRMFGAFYFLSTFFFFLPALLF